MTNYQCLVLQGVKGIPLSVDLWIHYLNHVKTVQEVEGVRAVYERAMEHCGREWKSDKIWDHYVKWEQEKGTDVGVFQLYHRILATPTHGINKNFETFKTWLNEKNPKDLLETTEFLNMRKEALGKVPEDEANGDEGSGAAPGENDEGDLLTAEETKTIREMIVTKLKAIMKVTEERIGLRSKYEEGIKRPYFHVKPLERGQLKNWNDYLEFMSKEMSKEGGDMTEVEILYERALIACALYEEFWLNYINWWRERDGDNTEKIRDIYRRACTFHLQEKVDIHIQWAAFEEKLKNFDAAAEVLENIEKTHPQMITLVMARIGLAKRRGDHEKVTELYENIIKNATSKTTASEMSIKFARYLRLQVGNVSRAGQVISSALETDPTNPKLYLQQMDLLINTVPMDVIAVSDVFDKALEQEFPDKHKLLFSQRKLEFLGDFGSDVTEIENVKKAHQKLVQEIKEKGDSTNGNEDKDKKVENGTATYAPVNTNSSSYSAQQAQAYNNYGARYNNYQQGYGQWGQGQGY